MIRGGLCFEGDTLQLWVRSGILEEGAGAAPAPGSAAARTQPARAHRWRPACTVTVRAFKLYAETPPDGTGDARLDLFGPRPFEFHGFDDSSRAWA